MLSRFLTCTCQFDSHEDPHLLHYAGVWIRKLRDAHPSRLYVVSTVFYLRTLISTSRILDWHLHV